RLQAHVGFVPNDLLASNLQNRLVGKHSADLPLVDHPHDGDPTTNARHAVAPFQDSPPTLESLLPHRDEVIQSCLFVSRTASPQGEIVSRAGDKNICAVRDEYFEPGLDCGKRERQGISQGNLLWREQNVTLAAKARPVLRPNNGEDQMRY